MVENGAGTLPLENEDVRNHEDVEEAADFAQYSTAPRPLRPLATLAVCLISLASLFFVGIAVGRGGSHGSLCSPLQATRSPEATVWPRGLEPVMKWGTSTVWVGVGLGVGWVCDITFRTWATGIGSWIAYKTSRLVDHVIEESSKFNDKVDTFNENFSSEASKFNDTFKWLGYDFYGFLVIYLVTSIYDRIVPRPAAA